MGEGTRMSRITLISSSLPSSSSRKRSGVNRQHLTAAGSGSSKQNWILRRPTVHLVIFVVLSLLLESTYGSLPGAVNGSDEGGSSSNQNFLATSPHCHSEVLRLCGRKSENLGDLDVLECIMNKRVSRV